MGSGGEGIGRGEHGCMDLWKKGIAVWLEVSSSCARGRDCEEVEWPQLGYRAVIISGT